MYSVYFDDILQRPEDIININDVMETSIVRQDGFDSQQQIIREKSDATLEFTGQAYSYVCNILKENSCHVFNVRIEETCGYIYNATMSIVGMERDLHKCICKTDLKDNSFSAYIDGYLNTELALYNTKTKNCEILEQIIKPIIMPYDVNDNTLTYSIQAFDVLDTFKYIISYFTDNSITVVSDYLTTNKYAITTGYNMHNFGNSAIEIYPFISFQKLFNELRKKLRLYMAIEYDGLGNPYLRIEEENYFFADVELFSIDEIPRNAIQTYDNKRNFNKISVGSDTTKVQSGTPITYPQERYTSWIKEFYTNCGSCVGEKDSELDLVSSYIIDSNIIIEALIFSTSDEYENDDSIFLFNYSNINGIDTGVFSLDSITGDYYYNETLRNDNVLNNYLDYYNECLAIQRNSKYGFYALYRDFNIKINTSATQCCGFDNINYLKIIYDNLDSISLDSTSMTSCVPLPITDFFKAFTCQENGQYNFKANLYNISQDTSVFELNDVIYSMKIKVFTDNTMTSLIDEYEATDTQDGYTSVTLNIETGNIDLVIGNFVMVTMYVESCPVVYPTDIYFYSDFASFELISDNFICDSITTNEDTKPYELTFDYKLCFEQYNIANLNKKGYIKIGGFPHWIKELRYKHGGISSFSLMSNQLLCSCTNQ